MTSTKFSNFDVVGWLNDYYSAGTNLNYDDLKPVLSFTLLWNLFESNTCEGKATLAGINTSVMKADGGGELIFRNYEEYLDIFRTRYSQHPEEIDNLGLRPKEKDAVRALMGDSVVVSASTVVALLLIAKGVRNNFFHGNAPKQVDRLLGQSQLFEVVNNLLADYMDNYNSIPPPVRHTTRRR